MGKLSALSTNHSPSTSDKLVSVQASGPTDVQVPISDLATLLGTSGGYNGYKFHAYRNAAQNSGNGVYSVVNFDTKSGAGYYDTGSNLDIVTNVGRFTAPIAGFYHFSFVIGFASNSVGCRTELLKNGSFFEFGGWVKNSSYPCSLTYSNDIQLAANDYIEAAAFSDSGPVALAVGAGATTFSGHLISAT